MTVLYKVDIVFRVGRRISISKTYALATNCATCIKFVAHNLRRMVSLKKVSCKAFLDISPVGTLIPYKDYPGTLRDWIEAWAMCMGCPIDNLVLGCIQECVEHGSCTVVNTDCYFREQVRFIGNSMGIHYSLTCTARHYVESMCVVVCISSDWAWCVPDFARLSLAQCRRVSRKRLATVDFLSDLAGFYAGVAAIEKEFTRRPRLFSCLPWAWRGCCVDCGKVKRLVEELPNSMYGRCFQRLVGSGLAGRDFGVGIYITD